MLQAETHQQILPQEQEGLSAPIIVHLLEILQPGAHLVEVALEAPRLEAQLHQEEGDKTKKHYKQTFV